MSRNDLSTKKCSVLGSGGLRLETKEEESGALRGSGIHRAVAPFNIMLVKHQGNPGDGAVGVLLHHRGSQGSRII
jgi:hypothetical protein